MANEDYLKKFLNTTTQVIKCKLPGSVIEAIYDDNFVHLVCEAPASTRWHGNYRGGLMEHNYHVLESAVALSQPFIEDNLVNMSDVVEAVFWHDSGKVGLFNKSGALIQPYYVKDDKGGYVYNKNISSSHQEFSVSNYMVFSEYPSYEIVKAIRYHNMLYTDNRKDIGEETALLLLLHWADMYASRFLV